MGLNVKAYSRIKICEDVEFEIYKPFYETYLNFKEAFQIASDGGVVQFI